MTSSANAACRIQRRERIVSDATTFGLYERAAPNEASVASVSHPLVLAGALAVAGLGWLLLRAPHRAGRPLIALVLVTAGAVGNYLDRIFRGYVVDFVHLKHWPVFSVADVYITLGYVVFAGVLLARWRRGEVAGGG